MTPKPVTAPQPEPRWLVFGLMASVTFVGLLSELIPSGILPQMADDLGVTESRIGMLVGVYALASALGTIPLIQATLPVNRKHLLLIRPPARRRPSPPAQPRCPMREVGLTIVMLTLSNVFMTFAWYAHLKELSTKPWIIAVLASWGVALFEYMFQVPANRIGYTVMSLAQLKIIQEAITLLVFVPFAFLYMKEPLKLDYLWAGLCIMGAVFFIFRGGMGTS